MKKLLVFLIFTNTSLFLRGWFSPKNEDDLARKLLRILRIQPLEEIKIDACIKKINDECIELGFCYKDVLLYCIRDCNWRISFFGGITKSSKERKSLFYTTSVLCGISIICAILYIACSRKKNLDNSNIINKLSNLGAQNIYYSGSYASAYIPSHNRSEARWLLRILAAGDPNSSLQGAFCIIGGFCGLAGFGCAISYIYADSLHKQYLLIRQRLEKELSLKSGHGSAFSKKRFW